MDASKYLWVGCGKSLKYRRFPVVLPGMVGGAYHGCKQIGPARGGEYRRKSMAICRVDALSNFVDKNIPLLQSGVGG